MDLLRIGEKVISKKRVLRSVDKIFELRAMGISQTETAKKVGVDRTLVSRLESLGEVRKGAPIAVLGFPIKNRDEVEAVLNKEGVEFYLILTEEQRRGFLHQNGLELFNYVMDIIAQLKEYDQVVVIGSNYRIELMSAVIGRDVVGLEIGKSPIEEDKLVSLEEVRRVIKILKGGGDS
ncbi:transcriptional regulator [Metallumcola ferriviriculae]|uniref:Transcriptional regulator n=1 Tax=Metallumcola ferriviriculae TaxID=3039180 RepID=A0AAU0UHM2_9FIRM|nr:transcriptional regulator [Desulfitibacteraceae bacterium MK1]